MSTDAQLKRTPLHELHLELGARMVPFAGFDMPVQYPAGIMAEHRHTRAQAGLFDVSHMGQVILRGEKVAAALETLLPADVVGIAPGEQRYSFFTTDAGGIIDDLMVANLGERWQLVVNAACRDQDLAHLRARLGAGVDITLLSDRGLLALQGPAAAAVLTADCPALATLPFMHVLETELFGAACIISRSGYTGEDGFEISAPSAATAALARRLLADPRVKPVGLGARDSLRLEAGLCLYGHDIDADTSPVEAGLSWAIPRCRRPDGERAGGFPGAGRILQQLAHGPDRRRVGIRPDGRAPVRAGTELRDEQGATVGRVTSGGFGPSVDAPVAMGYVTAQLATAGKPLDAIVRGKAMPAKVAKLPFVPQRYYRGPAPAGQRNRRTRA